MILESPNVDLPKLSLWFRRSFLRKWGTVIPIAFPSLLGLCLSTPPTPKKILTRNCQVKSCRLSLKSCQRQRISTSFPRFFVLWTNPPMTIPSLEKFWLFFYCQCEGFPSSSISANPRLHKFAIPFSGSFLSADSHCGNSEFLLTKKESLPYNSINWKAGGPSKQMRDHLGWWCVGVTADQIPFDYWEQ